MISERTALILGAGASWTYGFPLGHELTEEIIRLTDPKRESEEFNRFQETVLVNQGIAGWPDLKDFHSDFKGSRIGSVDKFLSYAQITKPRYVSIGKHAIAYLIAGCENLQTLKGMRLKGDDGFMRYQLVCQKIK